MGQYALHDPCDECGVGESLYDSPYCLGCRDDREVLDGLSKGDEFWVDCHHNTLRVHSTGPFVGAIVLDAYDNEGAHWPIGEVDGQLYLGYEQLKQAENQQRAKEIGFVLVADVGGESDE